MPPRHERLIFQLIDDLAVYDDNPIRVERAAVLLFARIHRQLQPEEE